MGLPKKLLTFLFTDIEGSTVLWERDADAMSSALLYHDGILHGLIALHRGQVFKTVGDGFHATFERASAALDAAIAIREVFERVPWRKLGELRVRIVLHTGEAEYRDKDYYGPTVNRVARLLDATAGGQVLISEATVRMLDRRPPPGVALRDLGDIPLKGVPEPIHAYALEGRRAPDTPEVDVAGECGRPPVFRPIDATAVDRPEVDRPTDRDLDGSAVAEATPTAGDTLCVYTLGGFRVERGGRQIHPDGSKRLPGAQLFKCLVTRERRRLSKFEASALFFEKSGDAADKTMRSALSRFRDVVEPGVPVDQSIIDNSRGGAIQIRPGASLWVDADAFEQLIARARRAEHPDDMLEEADRLYRGEYLPDDRYEEWAIPRRGYLLRLWVDLQFDLARCRERRGDVDNALAALERLLAADACDERAARELMLLLARHGRGSSALRVFQRLAEALAAELEAQPSSETLEVRRQIRDGEIQAADGPTRQPGGPISHSREATRPSGAGALPLPRIPAPKDESAAPAPPGPPSAASSQGTPTGPSEFEPAYPFPEPELLVGRQRELLELHRALDRGRSEGQTLLIGAPGGTGKSTLAGLLVDRARSMGYLCLAGGSFDQDSPSPFAPIRDALCDYLLEQPPDRLRADLGDLAADLVLIIPQLGDHLGNGWGRATGSPDPGRLMTALERYLRRLAAAAPVVLCLEDLHAADGATLEAVHYLARRTRRLPVTLVGTYRTEEVSAERPLAGVLAALRRERLSHELVLRSFDRSETHVLISSLLDGEVSEGLTDALFAVTEGNPLFVEQLVLALREEGRIERRSGIWHQLTTDDAPVPPVIRAVIERRFDRLPPNARETLEMAAVMGQAFNLQPLIAAVGAKDAMPVVATLDRAVAAQLVRETTNGYRFGHAMIREALYRSLSRTRRSMLHARAGEAIEHSMGKRAHERAAELALHFALAAEVAPVAEKALHFSLLAGRRAVTFTSHREALEHFVRAYQLADRLDTSNEGARVEALTGRLNAERELSMWTECIASCRNLIAMTDDPVRRAWARSSISKSLCWMGDTANALREADEGLAELRGATDTVDVIKARVRLMYDRSYLLFMHGRFREVYDLGREILDVATPLDSVDRLILPHHSMSLGAMGLHDVDRALYHLDEKLRAAEEAQIRLSQAVTHENAGIILHRAGQLEPAAARLRRALELYQATASDLRAVNATQALGRVLLAQGDIGGALHQAELALAHAVAGQDRWAAECYDLLGSIQILRAQWANATTSFERALAIHEAADDLADTADSLTGLGTVAELCGDWPGAERLYRRAIGVADRMDPAPEQIGPRRQLARLLLRRGDLAGGDQYVAEALALINEMQPTIEYGQALLVLAERQLRARCAGDAVATLDQALRQGASVDVLVEAHAAATDARIGSGDLDAARGHAAEAMQLATRIGTPRQLGMAQLALARLATVEGQCEAGQEAFEAAIREFEATRTPYDLASALRDYGRTLIASPGDSASGHDLIVRAKSMFEQVGARPDAEALA